MGREGERWNKCSPGRLEKGTFDCSNFLPDIGRFCAWNGFNKMLRLHSRSENLLWGETPGGCQNVQGEVRELQIQLVKMLGLEMMEMCFVASATLRKNSCGVQTIANSSLYQVESRRSSHLFPSTKLILDGIAYACHLCNPKMDAWYLVNYRWVAIECQALQRFFFCVCVKVRCQAPRLTKGLWADWVPLWLSDNRRYFEAVASCWWLST